MANQYDFFNLMKSGGYNPMDGGITTNQMKDFRLQGLINDMNQVNEKINSLNLPPAQEKKSANIFQKIGSAFGQYGMDNRMAADDFVGLPKDQRRAMQMQGLQNFANQMNLIGAQQSGNPQRLALAQQNMMNFQERKKQQEDERKAEEKAAQKQQRYNDIYNSSPPEIQRMMDMYGAGVPKDVIESQFEKPNTPNSYEEYSLATRDPSPEGYLDFLNRNMPKEKQPTAKQIYDNLAAGIKTKVALYGVDSLPEYERIFYNTYLLRQNTGGFDRFLQDYIEGQGSSNDTGIIDTGERTSDGEKIVMRNGKKYVEVD